MDSSTLLESDRCRMFTKPDYTFGVGINYRTEISENILKHIDEIDFIELNTEQLFVAKTNLVMNQIINAKPVVLHGLTLSIGTFNEDIPKNYIENLTKTLQEVDCKWFSEHIGITNVNGVEIRSLMPVEFTYERVHEIALKTEKIMTLSEKPFLLENITYYYSMPNSYLSELCFINDIIEKTNCGILLDLNNLYVNSINHKYDSYEFIDKLPLEHIVEVYLAGCSYMHKIMIDIHVSSIRKEVLLLFKYLCNKTQISGVVIERDAKLDNFLDLTNEVIKVRDILKKQKKHYV